MDTRTGTVVFLDLVGFSTTPDPAQLAVAQSFMKALGDELQALWQKAPARKDITSYLVLPTGDGAAVIIWDGAPGHPRREFSALWLAGKMLVWAKSQVPPVGVRCGINSGELDFLNDPYGLPNVCGAAINVAQRIMDAAQQSQILAHHETFAQRLLPAEGMSRTDFRYTIDATTHEILAKHLHLLKVHGITGSFTDTDGEKAFGIGGEPANRWYLQVDPPILHLDAYGVKRLKKPPVELLLKHNNIAFVGATNDQLAAMVQEALQGNPTKVWENVVVLFLTDDRLGWLATGTRTHDVLKADKAKAILDLKDKLAKRTKQLEFFEYDRPLYFASYWDWDKPGGRIHVSPYIWGADIRVCPALDYSWITSHPTPEYQAYVEGLRCLRQLAKVLNPK